MNALVSCFDWIIERSWQASLLVGLILLVQLALLRWLPAVWRHALWLPLLALLVLPALPESRLSVFNWFTPAPPVSIPEIRVGPGPFETFHPEPEPPAQMAEETGVVPVAIHWKEAFAVIWGLVAVVMLAILVRENREFRRRLKRLREPEDERLRDLLEECRARLGIRARVRLVQMPGQEGPAVAGMFCPHMLLPEGFTRAFDDDEIRLILLHELGHWVRGDVHLNMLLAVLRAVHWFNPVLWFAFRRIRADRELACDEWVLKRSGETQRGTYGEALLRLSTGFTPSGAEALGIFESRSELRRRIQWIAGFSTGARQWWRIGAIPAAVLAVTFLTRAVTPDIRPEPGVGRIVDRNGVLLAEYWPRENQRPLASYPLGAFAASLLWNLDRDRLPKPGEVVVLTIDARAQMAAEEALRKVPRGAAVIVDPANGDILAMASVPSFDPNRFFPEIDAKEWKALNDDETSPLLNRAVNAYSPGAAYTMVTALAGERAGVGNRRFTCDGTVTYGNVSLKCWIFGKGAHGSIDLEHALKESCGAFFYQYGNAAGIEIMTDTARQLGLGQKTGVPIRGENPGMVDSPESLAKINPRDTWRPGLTANVSIGMGSTLASPLQLTMVAASLANGGKVYLPRLIERREAMDRPVKVEPAKVRNDLVADAGIAPNDIERVRRGMWRAVNESGGTAIKARLPGMDVAGKTGSAQIWRMDSAGNRVADINGWFTGFATRQKDRYAICVIVQGAKSGGGSAAPLAAWMLSRMDASEPKSLAPAKGSFEPVVSIAPPSETN
jgi:beta-lactamase regulating signal transducer with metallopeptidase domain